jgi:mRNA interferase RelE/StbE
VHEVLIERGAEKDLNRLPTDVFQRVVTAIRALKDSARPPGSKKLAGAPPGWRVRVGDYRIVYEIDDRAKCVRVLRVRHRREVYR